MNKRYKMFVRECAPVVVHTAAIAAALFIQVLAFAGTPANTLISNQATATFIMSGTPKTEYSNIDTFRVDELVDLTVVSNNPTGVNTQSPSTGNALSFTLTNIGNGSEAYSLVFAQLVNDDFDASNVKIYLDGNSNGSFESLSDTLYVPGSNDPTLAPAQSIHIFIVGDIPASLATGLKANEQLTATSLKGTGAPGTSFPGAGTGGVTAVLGLHGGQDSATSYYLTSTAAATVTKSQSILDPLGGNHPVQNAVITYTLALAATGIGTLTSVAISDNVPTGTTYVANSLLLDGSPLTDSADLDAGVFNGTGILVTLGTVSAPTTHTVTFKVRIQ